MVKCINVECEELVYVHKINRECQCDYHAMRKQRENLVSLGERIIRALNP